MHDLLGFVLPPRGFADKAMRTSGHGDELHGVSGLGELFAKCDRLRVRDGLIRVAVKSRIGGILGSIRLIGERASAFSPNRLGV